MDLASGFPTTAMEFEQRFETEEACIAFLTRQRWGRGFRCGRCGGEKGWALRARPVIVSDTATASNGGNGRHDAR